jgi:hypothetical protein
MEEQHVSPIVAIHKDSDDGSEYWSARDLSGSWIHGAVRRANSADIHLHKGLEEKERNSRLTPTRDVTTCCNM